jgi:hypothetical protein
LAYRGRSPDSKSSEVVFFLGAGASVKAGVPSTYSFVNEYIKSIKEPAKKDKIKKIVKTLKQWKKDEIDIELLLETLTKLKDKDQEPLLQFYKDGNFFLGESYDIKPLIDDLKDFIKSKAIVESEEKIRYLQSFREIIEESGPLDIISVNYDTCIEQFCNCYRLFYQDGFDVYWNPVAFQKEYTDIRLYKIHGSVIWYQSDRGGYIKLPVMTKESKVQLITGEKAENLMLYPMQKWDYAEPLLELLVKIKHLLESESCKFLIVVGYSFRDVHIIRILWDVARKNRELHLLLIDPDAYQIYSKKIKYYDTSEKIPSSLDGKVICLPYLFEKVFPYVKNYYLKKIKEGFAYETSQHQIEIQGEKANWISCLQSFADAEYIEKIETILKKEPLDAEKYWSINLEISLKMAVNLIINGEKKKGVKYFRDFCNFLNKVMVERIDVGIVDATGMIGIYQIEFKFNSITRYDTKTNLPSGSSYAGVPQFKTIIEPLSEFCQTRAGFINGSRNDLLKISEKLGKIKDYLGTLNDGKISVEDYIRLRENKIPDIEQFTNQYKIYKKDGLPLDQQRELNAILVEVERNTLREIIDEK